MTVKQLQRRRSRTLVCLGCVFYPTPSLVRISIRIPAVTSILLVGGGDLLGLLLTWLIFIRFFLFHPRSLDCLYIAFTLRTSSLHCT